MSTDNLEKLILISAIQGETFKDLFYSICDTNRAEFHLFFNENAILVWEGNGYKGFSEIGKFIATLPKSRHTIYSFDTHPISVPSADANPADFKIGISSLLVTVTGHVTYGISSEVHPFHHTFVLEANPSQGNNSFNVLSFVSRHTAKPKSRERNGQKERKNNASSNSQGGNTNRSYRGRGRGRGRNY